MDLHRPLRIFRASRLKTASDKMLPPRLQEKAITFYDDRVVKNDRDLPLRRPHPVTKRGDREDRRHDENNPAPSGYGWPQFGHVARPSRRFFPQCGHGTRLPLGRVTRWTINPMTHVAGIQPRMVTSWAFSEFRALASFMIQIAVKIQAPTLTRIKST